MAHLKLTDLNLNGKYVLYRGPFNLPLDEKKGEITDIYRVERALPSIMHILQEGAKPIFVSYFGRPKGYEEKYKMDSVGKKIQETLQKNGLEVIIRKLDAVVGDEVKDAIRNMKQNEIPLLENTRFYKGNIDCDPEFSKQLASLADVFVYDGPNDMYRRYSDTFGVTEHLISAAGFLMDEEITTLRELLNPPKDSILALGGAKVKGKFETIEGLVEKYHKVIIGGGMANTFLAATGFGVGGSSVEATYFEKIKKLLAIYGEKILLPIDVVASNMRYKIEVKVRKNTNISQNYRALDTGHATNQKNVNVITEATGYILWNGPFGLIEEGFIEGTLSIARSMSEKYGKNKTIILGGDTHNATERLDGFKFEHILVGGGSSLIFLEKKGDLRYIPGLLGLELSYEKLKCGGYGPKAQELVK